VFIFPVFHEEFLDVAKTAQGLKGMVLKKKFVLPIVLGFHFFFNKNLAHGST
jgi:hypothetical protein